MPTPTINKPTRSRGLSGLTSKGTATVALIAVRDTWDTLTPAQRHECGDLVERLNVALRAANTASPVPAGGNVPMVGRIVA